MNQKNIYHLGTKDVMSGDVVCAIKNIHHMDKTQFQGFHNSRLFTRTVALDTSIKKNNFSIFKATNTKGQSSKRLLNDLKIYVSLFSQTYISHRIGHMN